MRITADVANNSVLVYANEDEYRIIERALNQLDRPKLQVAIDVTIAEVTLNHDLSYGVQFFLTNNNHGSVSFTTGTTLPIIAPICRASTLSRAVWEPIRTLSSTPSASIPT